MRAQSLNPLRTNPLKLKKLILRQSQRTAPPLNQFHQPSRRLNRQLVIFRVYLHHSTAQAGTVYSVTKVG